MINLVHGVIEAKTTEEDRHSKTEVSGTMIGIRNGPDMVIEVVVETEMVIEIETEVVVLVQVAIMEIGNVMDVRMEKEIQKRNVMII